MTFQADDNPPLGPIELVVVQATPYCNLDCDYCYLPGRDSKEQLSFDVLRSVFCQLFKSQLTSDHLTIVWHAGEPLVMPIKFYAEAIQIIEQLCGEHLGSACSITHSFQTNATLLTGEWCRFIQQEQIQIGVSLDGPAFLHDAHRKTRTGIGSHASTLRGIRQLEAQQIPFHVITVLTHDSLDYPDEIFNFFCANNICRIGFNIDELEGVHQTSSFLKVGTEVKYRDFMRRFYQLTKSSSLAFEIREFEYLKQLICHGSSEHPPSNQQIIPLNILSIDAKGDFTTFSPELLSVHCQDYGDFKFGNLVSTPLRSITANKKFQAIYDAIHLGVERCKETCEYFSLCGGGAPANKYFENRSFATSETIYCKYGIKILADLMLADVEAALASEIA